MIPLGQLAGLTLSAALESSPSNRELRRHHGVILPVKPAPPKRVVTRAERRKRRDSTRAKRARAQRQVMREVAW